MRMSSKSTGKISKILEKSSEKITKSPSKSPEVVALETTIEKSVTNEAKDKTNQQVEAVEEIDYLANVRAALEKQNSKEKEKTKRKASVQNLCADSSLDLTLSREESVENVDKSEEDATGKNIAVEGSIGKPNTEKSVKTFGKRSKPCLANLGNKLSSVSNALSMGAGIDIVANIVDDVTVTIPNLLVGEDSEDPDFATVMKLGGGGSKDSDMIKNYLPDIEKDDVDDG